MLQGCHTYSQPSVMTSTMATFTSNKICLFAPIEFLKFYGLFNDMQFLIRKRIYLFSPGSIATAASSSLNPPSKGKQMPSTPHSPIQG